MTKVHMRSPKEAYIDILQYYTKDSARCKSRTSHARVAARRASLIRLTIVFLIHKKIAICFMWVCLCLSNNVEDNRVWLIIHKFYT